MARGGSNGSIRYTARDESNADVVEEDRSHNPNSSLHNMVVVELKSVLNLNPGGKGTASQDSGK